MQNKANLHKAQMGTSRYEQKDCEEKSRRDVRKKQSQFIPTEGGTKPIYVPKVKFIVYNKNRIQEIAMKTRSHKVKIKYIVILVSWSLGGKKLIGIMYEYS